MNKQVLYWGLYDFANSVVLLNFLFYFSQWLVADQGHPSWWYNGALIVSSILYIASAPYFSRRADLTGSKLFGLRIWTLVSAVLMGAVAMIALSTDSLDGFAVILYTAGMYAYLMCFLYFTPMLNDLSSYGDRGKISGIGQGFNSAGQVAGLLFTLPFVNGMLTLWGEPGRAQALLPAVALFVLFALPMLLLYRESTIVGSEIRHTPGTPFSLVRTIFANRSLALILIAYFFFSDALLTFANNFPLYLENVFAVPDTTKALLTIAILGLAAVGAPLFGLLADRWGHKRTLFAVLCAFGALLVALAFTQTFPVAIVLSLCAGVLFGPVWAISRAMVGQFAPEGLVASSFNYYIVAERFATFLGPLTWSAVLLVVGETVRGYQYALIAMAILLAIGLALVAKINDRSAA